MYIGDTQQYQHYSENDTPIGLDNVPDQMKPIAYKHSQNQNLDILISKYYNNGQLTDIELQQLNSQQKITLEEVKKKTETKTKRPDQYQKLFFKKAFKYAENEFFKKKKKNRSRLMSQFYHHHFDSAAKSLKLPIFTFYHPDKKTKPGLATGQKSFNSAYVKLILKSLSFRKVCQQYHDKFKQECRMQRTKKISTFSSGLFRIMQKSREDRTKLIRYLQGSKCKIPWCDRDIQEAYKRAGEELDDYGLTVVDNEEIILEKRELKKGQNNKPTKDNKTNQTVIDIQDSHQIHNDTIINIITPCDNDNLHSHELLLYSMYYDDEKPHPYYSHDNEDIQLLHYEQEVDDIQKMKRTNDYYHLTTTTTTPTTITAKKDKSQSSLSKQRELLMLLAINDHDHTIQQQEAQSENGSLLRANLDEMTI